MRGRDLRPGEPTWTYRPASHKTAWRGRKRVIPLGPKARGDRPRVPAAGGPGRLPVRPPRGGGGAPRPAGGGPEVEADALGAVEAPSEPGGGHARRYSRSSYLNAVRRACDRAFPHPSLSKVASGRS